MIPRYKRLPPRVFEPDHLVGFVLTLLLNILIWSPYIFLLFALTCWAPFSEEGRHFMSPPPAGGGGGLR